MRAVGLCRQAASAGGSAAAFHWLPVVKIETRNDAIADEAQAIIGEIETAVVKQAISFHSARTLTPAAGQALIRETAERAVRS